MNKRRTLIQSLQKNELSELALAFVNEGKPQEVETIDQSQEEPSQEGDSTVSGVVSVSVRLPAELAARLVRVSLERKLRRREPFTQQDIVAEALTVWLKSDDDSL